MKKLTHCLGLFLFLSLLLIGCQKDVNLNQDQELATSELQVRDLAAKKAQIEALVANLPPRVKEQQNAKIQSLLNQHPEFMAKVRAMAEEEVCDDYTPINQWLDAELADWDFISILYAVLLGFIDFPMIDALVFENNYADQTFGQNGERTQIMNKTFKDLNRFWDIDSDEIVLIGAHGNMLADYEKVLRTEMAYWGETEEEAAPYAELIVELIQTWPEYRGGNHPIFTFNAMASDGPWEFNDIIIPAKIIMGDGIMEGYTAIGFGDIAPQAILAHEYAHQVQFQLDVFGDATGPEATRRTELMADAMAAYYLSHARGASMQWKRVQQFLAVFFNIGDCSVTNDSHHGTPQQRMEAARWGYELADQAQKQGHILPSSEVVRLFEEALPSLVE